MIARVCELMIIYYVYSSLLSFAAAVRSCVVDCIAYGVSVYVCACACTCVRARACVHICALCGELYSKMVSGALFVVCVVCI